MERTEIIKALECCKEGQCHNGCPLLDFCNVQDVLAGSSKLCGDALALINSQEQRIKELKQCMEHEHASFMETFGEYGEKCERLEIELNAMRTAANSYKMHYEKLEAENERLHASCTELAQCFTKIETLYKVECKRVDTIKAYTVQKYRECLYRELASLGAKDKFNKEFFLTKVDQVAKEMLDES